MVIKLKIPTLYGFDTDIDFYQKYFFGRQYETKPVNAAIRFCKYGVCKILNAGLPPTYNLDLYTEK